MSKIEELAHNVEIGKAKLVPGLVQECIDEGDEPIDILNKGMIDAMAVVGEKFKNNEIFVPEVLVAARAMNQGVSLLKPLLQQAGVQAAGRVCIGTVQGDLHDIGKNLVKMMMEGKGLEVIDLGTDVSADTFVRTAIEQHCDIICCSALLTTTMGEMKNVVDAVKASEMNGKVKIMIGGAPITQTFCEQIDADCYTPDAASAAEAALKFCVEAAQ